MAATDYIIVTGFASAYLARKKKSTSKTQTMSQDRRPITDGEIIGLFEFYLRNWCDKHDSDTVFITQNGKRIFKAKLLDNENGIMEGCEE